MKLYSNFKISVLISDSNKIFLSGLVSIVNKFPRVHNICSAYNPKEMKTLCSNVFFELLLIDIDMLGVDPANFIQLFKKVNPKAKVILLSSFGDLHQIKKLFITGATGYLNKSASMENIHLAIEQVLLEKFYVDKDFKETVIKALFDNVDNHCLSNLEVNIMFLISHQFSNKQIAQILALSEKAIEYHRLNLFKSLGIKNMVGLGVYAVRNNIYFNENLIKKYRKLLRQNPNHINV